MKPGPPLFASSLPAIAAWLDHNPRAPAGFDDAAFADIASGLMGVITSHGPRPEVRAALIKMLAAVSSLDVLHGTEQEVFAVSLALREDFYGEVMMMRRAVISDRAAGAFDA